MHSFIIPPPWETWELQLCYCQTDVLEPIEDGMPDSEISRLGNLIVVSIRLALTNDSKHNSSLGGSHRTFCTAPYVYAVVSMVSISCHGDADRGRSVRSSPNARLQTGVGQRHRMEPFQLARFFTVRRFV